MSPSLLSPLKNSYQANLSPVTFESARMWFSKFHSLLARALNVSSKVMALMLRVARIASLSAMDVSSVELGTWAASGIRVLSWSLVKIFSQPLQTIWCTYHKDWHWQRANLHDFWDIPPAQRSWADFVKFSIPWQYECERSEKLNWCWPLVATVYGIQSN